MKSISGIVLAVVLLLIASKGYAQGLNKNNKTPRWVSGQGFWQIETSIHTPDKNIVYFYNNDHVLIYKEKVDGIVLNLKKKQVKMRLKKALETAIHTWNRDSLYRDDQQLISMFFGK
jgi:hypothetical protein